MTITDPISRRSVLKAGAATTAGLVGATSLGVSFAGAATTVDPVVIVFLRGGQDHLSTVVPYTDAEYYALRPGIAIPDTEVLPLDGQFGFHPVLTGLHALYGQQRLAVVVGAGNPALNRSHFIAQDLFEFGDVQTPGDNQGWLARYLNGTGGTDDSLFRGLTSGNNVNLSLRGYPALGIADIAGFGLGGVSGFTSDFDRLTKGLYAGDQPAENVGTAALNAADEVTALGGSTNPDPVARAFEDIATLLDATLGVEVVTYNIGGWDTHNSMGTSAAGEMRDLLEGLDQHLAAFQADLDARGLGNVTTVLMTEFGRRADENGSGGTDHGDASVMMVVGDNVNGGVYGTVPTLTPANIGARLAVPVAVDFRDVLSDVVTASLGVADPSTVFPGHTHTPLGIM